MTPRWEDLNARARGLSTHLLRRAGLEAAARSANVPSLAAELRQRGYPLEEGSRASAAEVELAARRAAAARFATLVRWLGRTRTDALAVLVEDEERRSLRALIRGAVERAPAELRLAGLLPTPGLPERALGELARQPTPRAVASLLVAWRHPYGALLFAGTTGPETDLFGLESALSRLFAERALRAARHAGRILERHVREVIDVENAFAALVLSGEPEGGRGPHDMLPGGRFVSAERFAAAIAGHDPGLAGRVLAEAFAGTPLAKAFAQAGTDPGGMERAVLRAQIAGLHGVALREPLSVAPLLEYALRLRAELLDVRWITWGVSLGAPGQVLAGGLVTVT